MQKLALTTPLTPFSVVLVKSPLQYVVLYLFSYLQLIVKYSEHHFRDSAAVASVKCICPLFWLEYCTFVMTVFLQ